MIRFDEKICGQPGEARTREWVETNGVGGFASSTIAGLNTRRYHGLLVAATRPPVGRLVLLSKLEETLVIDGRRFELSANQYPGVIHPQGFKYQTGFRLDPFPVFTYTAGGIEIEKSVFMIQGENSTCLRYVFRLADGDAPHAMDDGTGGIKQDGQNNGKQDGGRADAGSSLSPFAGCFFEVRPLVAFRDYHSLAREDGRINRAVSVESPNAASVALYEESPALHFAHDAAGLDAGAGVWYRSFEYEAERERGFDFREDLFSPFVLRFDLSERAGACVIASTERRDIRRLEEYREAETARRRRITEAAPEDDFLRTLKAAADQFVVARGDAKTVIAGYPWFSDWGRDTMIALPGLTLVNARFDDARSILSVFARHVDRGMIPNRFPDEGETPEYNTVDATLWFFEAARSFLQYSDDAAFVRDRLYDVFKDIIQWHERGTRHGIRVDDADGLLSAGEEGVQLTWMDAKVGEWVVTPRRGKPVEIQSLWYNALRVMEHFAREFGDISGQHKYNAAAARARESFERQFWNEEAGCLYDVIDGGRRDASIRPNQIFAVSLPHSMLSHERAARVVAVVERELLTPYGLRSLSPRDEQYRGRYVGDAVSRDGSYHQGTVWAWLMGHFITAYQRVHGETPEGRARAARWLSNFRQHFEEAGLGQVSEIFDGDAPHTPRGCIAQAWSVAELLRAAVEDVRYTGGADPDESRALTAEAQSSRREDAES